MQIINDEGNNALTAEDTRAFTSFFDQGRELAQSPYHVDEAAWHFKKALCLKPHDSVAYSELGRMYYTWWRCWEADEPLKKGMELKPCFSSFMNYGLNCNLGTTLKRS